VTKTKTREKVKKWRLMEKKDKRKWLEYLKQLQDKVFAKNAILLESTETSQVIRSKYKEVTTIFFKDETEQ